MISLCHILFVLLLYSHKSSQLNSYFSWGDKKLYNHVETVLLKSFFFSFFFFITVCHSYLEKYLGFWLWKNSLNKMSAIMIMSVICNSVNTQMFPLSSAPNVLCCINFLLWLCHSTIHPYMRSFHCMWPAFMITRIHIFMHSNGNDSPPLCMHSLLTTWLNDHIFWVLSDATDDKVLDLCFRWCKVHTNVFYGLLSGPALFCPLTCFEHVCLDYAIHNFCGTLCMVISELIIPSSAYDPCIVSLCVFIRITFIQWQVSWGSMYT